MTTCEPGARLVFTHGFVLNPRATAFCASTPAATITDGFDVFVQLVMAAMTTEPSASEPGGTSGDGFAPNAPTGPPPNAVEGATGAATGSATIVGLFTPAFSFGSASANDSFIFLSGTRSCGRVGPARHDSTVARSSSSVSV